jgi:hypothetical protein
VPRHNGKAGASEADVGDELPSRWILWISHGLFSFFHWRWGPTPSAIYR